jgi:amino acid adenylation domain-containing protein
MTVDMIAANLLRQGIQFRIDKGDILFQAPPGAMTPELREEVRRHKADLIAELQDESRYAPTSSVQQRLWFMDQLVSDSPLYNIPVLFALTGKVDIDLLERCFNEIIRRHDGLRTTYQAFDGQPAQVIAPYQHLTLPFIDLRVYSIDARSHNAERLLKQYACEPFNLRQGPIFRALLLQLDDDQYQLLLSVHHIAFDGWSTGVFLHELSMLYQAFAADQPSPLPELKAQPADITVWQNHNLPDEGLEDRLSYWRTQFADIPSPLELPTDFTAAPIRTYRGGKRWRALSPTLLTALEQLAHRENTTLFTVLLAAFNTLLHRYSGHTDLVVGTPVANRTHSEAELMLGCFVNTLPLRLKLDPATSFRDLLKQAHCVVLDGQSHQDLPLEKLIEALEISDRSHHSPLFQVMFTAQSVLAPVQMQDLNIWFVGEYITPTAKFDLTLGVEYPEIGACISAEYSTDLFMPATIDRMLGHYLTLLEGVAADPTQRLTDVPMLSEAERLQMLIEWNDNGVDLPELECIHTLFEQQAARTPDAVALIWEHEKLTYRELDQRANQLAHYLIGSGIGPEKLVGVCMNRSVDLIAGLLAVMKAGGAYVPLDPAYPADRIAFILEDASAPVLLTQESLLGGLPESQVKVICVDRDAALIGAQPTRTPQSGVTPANLGYIIYTSGSTGRPKGVALTHRNAVAMLAWASELYSDDELRGVLAATSICFDLSVFELYLPLSVGGTIILAQNALHLPALPYRDSVTLINTVPSAIDELVRAHGIPSSVRTVNLAGEPLKRALVQRVYSAAQVEKVYNLYGPSEDTTYSTCVLVDRSDPDEPSIGRPISNTQAYILDEHMQPVPVGIVGELFLSGEGVGREYLNRPELTAEKFIADPFRPGSRMYRTGDLTRYRPDGNIDFLGRRDHQVKIRGFRIELGEIEVTLEQHPAIREAVVMAREDQAGEKRLVAYLTLDDGEPTVAEMRAFLKEHLPEYMIASVFVFLDRLPLNPNGKVDRKALPAPTDERSGAESIVAPRTPIETELALTWADLLKMDQISIHDNFFDLGGHSLLATRMVSRIRDRFGVDLPLRRLFDEATIAQIAQGIEELMQDGSAPVPSLEGFGSSMEEGRL